jgi:Predicted membrane protein (DUF2178)
MTITPRGMRALLSLAALAAAGMFLGPDGWLGIDLGTVGSAVLYAALWVLVIFLARNPEAVFPEDASLAERQAWLSVVFVTLIALHFGNLLLALPALGAAADSISNPVSRPFGGNLGTIVVVWIVVASVMRSRSDEAVELDERDLRIQHSASRVANAVMTTLIVALIVLLIALPEQSRTWLRPMMAANALLALLIARDLAQNIQAVVRYRFARA